jgi:hypothetical protein
MLGWTKATVWLWITQGVLAALFLFAGTMKFIMPLDKLQLPVPVASLYFIGVAEILGALALALPGLLNIAPALTPVAAVGLVTIVAGATTITIEGGQVAAALLPFAVGVLAATVAYGRREWIAIFRSPSPAVIDVRFASPVAVTRAR